jgi:predicted transcriptional regulator
MEEREDDFAEDLVKLEQALARMTVRVGAAGMTAAEVESELASGKVTARGLLAGIYVNGAPAGTA